MDLKKEPELPQGGLSGTTACGLGARSNNTFTTQQPAEDDEIPLDTSSSDDSSSDVSMSASDSDSDSRETLDPKNASKIRKSSVQSINAETIAPRDIDEQEPALDSRKRKPTSPSTSIFADVPNKKHKFELNSRRPLRLGICPSDRSFLPAEIWQQVFTFVPPKTLGNLLCTNKLFNAYLDPLSPFHCSPPISSFPSHVAKLKPEQIWQASRRLFWHEMPSPLRDKSELDMWRLVCQKKCQTCGRTKLDSDQAVADEHNTRPNSKETRPIWPFGLRLCRACLVGNTVKEIDLLLSSSVPSLLVPALPFVLVTENTDVILPAALQNGELRLELQISKIFLSSQIEKIQHDFLSVKALGGPATEEWLKGLDIRGKELRADYSRWEKWEADGGTKQMQLAPFSDIFAIGRPSTVVDATLTVSSGPSETSACSQDQPATSSSSSATFPDSQLASLPIPHLSTEVANKRQHLVQDPPKSSSHRPKTLKEFEGLKASRRADIERRALELEPPLRPNVLAHIPSFQAATQISTPVDDNAWNLLKPRLLAQRADAEQRVLLEQHIINQSRVAQENVQEGHNAERAKQLIWDDVQGPLRAQISSYGDEIIRDGWREGRKVNKETGPHFAADVLIYVRKRFYAEITKTLEAARAVGQEPVCDPPQGPFTQKLTLENMKWIFDVKIRPHTESFRNELFFCNDCGGNNLKTYGLEGVVQHYAAKHTNILSLGSVVVHWRAEWPEVPPFHPDPMGLKASHVAYPGQPILASHPQHTSAVPQYHYNSRTPPEPAPGTGPMPYQPSPYRVFAPSANGQYPLGQSPYSHSHAFAPSPLSYIQPYPPTILPYVAHAPGEVGHPGYQGLNPYHAPHPGFPHNAFQSSEHALSSERHRVHLEEIARSSRELWTVFAGLKDLPGNVRVFVVLHHVVKKFCSRFSQSPLLALFIDGLSNNKEMRPVRNVNGLMCKACNLRLGGAVPTDMERRSFSLPQLVNHFNQRHIEQSQTPGRPVLDWTVDMVYIPDLSVLDGLRNLANMDDKKFAMISDAFSSNSYAHGSPYGIPSEFQNYWIHNNPYPTPTFGGSIETAERPSQSQLTGFFPSSAPISHQASMQIGSTAQAESGLTHASATHDSVSNLYHPDNVIQTSLDLLQPTGNTKLLQQRQDSKGQRAKSQQKSKGRKSRGKNVTRESHHEDSSVEDTKAEEEEKRQEEEIRAIWAAERAKAARLVSINQSQTQSREAEISTKVSESKSRSRSPRTEEFDLRSSHGHATQFHKTETPAFFQRHEADDLMAALENQLNRQQTSLEHRGHRSGVDNYAARERQPVRDSAPSLRREHTLERASRNRVPISTPAQVLEEYRPYAEQSHEQIFPPGYSEPIQGSRMAPLSADDGEYERSRRPEYNQNYTGQTHSRQSPPLYTELYELIPVQDSQGECFIRRPIRREVESSYVAYETDSRNYIGDQRSPFVRYPVEPWEQASKAESPPPRQPLDKAVVGPGIGMRRPLHGSLSFDDAAAYEEYDPRFPGTLPNVSSMRYMRQ